MAAQTNSQEGFAHLLLLSLILITAACFACSRVPISRHYSDGKGNVAGVSITDSGSNPGDSSEGSSDNARPSGGTIINSVPAVHSEPKDTPEAEQQKQVTPENETPKQGEIEFDVKDGNINIGTPEGNGKLQSLSEGDVEKQLDKSPVKVASASGSLVFTQNGTSAVTNFPLMLDPATGALTVTTPAGSKMVTILPADAVKSVQLAKVLDSVNPETLKGSSKDYSVGLQLENVGGVLSYRIDGEKQHKLLGLIPISTPITAFVSAENGQVTQTDESLLARLLNKIAP